MATTGRARRAVRAYRRGGVREVGAAVGRRFRGRGWQDDEHASVDVGTDARSRPLSAASNPPVSAEPAVTPMNAPYQVKVAGALDERWALIDAAIPAGAASALDVGCNLGDVAARCAERGLWTVGTDIDASLIAQAQARHGAVRNLAFMTMELTPDNVRVLPAFDVVLLLSVHHHWLRANGPDVAGSMLREVVERTNGVVVFESASRRVRYGTYPPDFTDNDEPSVTGYLESYLSTHVGQVVDRIVPLGKTPCVGDREPFRWSWALYRS